MNDEAPDLFGHAAAAINPTEYIVYHDESKEPGYWHVFLFVPVDSREMLLAALKEALKNSKYKRNDRSYKEIRGSSAGYKMADYWLSILASSFQVQRGAGMLPYTTGRTLGSRYPNRETILQFPRPPGCRMAVFQIINGHADLDTVGDKTRKIELTFRMGLQGACHYFHDDNNPMVLRSIFVDRERQYNRPLDRNWIFSKLSTRFRDYCSLSPECQINGEDVPDDDWLILDAADVLLGVIRNICVRPDGLHRRKKEHFRAVSPLLEDIQKGQKRMKRSRYGIFGTVSSARLENGQWRYSSLSDMLRQVYNNSAEMPI